MGEFCCTPGCSAQQERPSTRLCQEAVSQPQLPTWKAKITWYPDWAFSTMFKAWVTVVTGTVEVTLGTSHDFLIFFQFHTQQTKIKTGSRQADPKLVLCSTYNPRRTIDTTHRSLDCHSVIYIWWRLVTTVTQIVSIKDELPKILWMKKILWKNDLGKDWMWSSSFSETYWNKRVPKSPTI